MSRVGEHEYVKLRDLYGKCQVGGNFLLPEGYEGCHQSMEQWVMLGSGFYICKDCGKMHVCQRGECVEVAGSHGERVCILSGCVTMECEMKAERNALERMGPGEERLVKRKRDGEVTIGQWSSDLWNTVECIVSELLNSDKTRLCAEQEREKNESKDYSTFCRVLREMATDTEKSRWRPNLLCIVAQVLYVQKCRNKAKEGVNLDALVQSCTESITRLIMQHGWVRVWRQMQNVVRGREFITSMLYLMRMGITFQKRSILPKIVELQQLLPIQTLLPSVFKIRAKSITEGENIIKLDIRRIPM